VLPASLVYAHHNDAHKVREAFLWGKNPILSYFNKTNTLLTFLKDPQTNPSTQNTQKGSKNQ